MAAFTDRLKIIMEEKKFRQTDVILLTNQAGEASGIRIGKSHMSQYCSGKTTPRPDILHVLAKALGVSPLWLQGEDVPREPDAAADTAEGLPARNVLVKHFCNIYG
ncbi:MAG: helix-turn-helix domain-containing protein [Lachnospiraceae bacterium]|nr:helix-turn-helix domain-containing protein [Lachnospiraceae bacterium]